MRENRPLLSRVVDQPGTKGGLRAGNFPGPPKNTFCPGSWLHPGQKAPPLLSRVKPRPGTKGPFVLGGGFTRDKREGLLSRVVAPPGTKGVFGRPEKIPSPRPIFSPGWIYHSGQKGPVFPRSRLMLCFCFFLLLF